MIEPRIYIVSKERFVFRVKRKQQFEFFNFFFNFELKMTK
jgi:hypothetical protein